MGKARHWVFDVQADHVRY